MGKIRIKLIKFLNMKYVIIIGLIYYIYIKKVEHSKLYYNKGIYIYRNLKVQLFI